MRAAGVLASVLLVLGTACAVAGVYMLVGAGWALVTAAAPALLLAAVLIRGIVRAA